MHGNCCLNAAGLSPFSFLRSTVLCQLDFKDIQQQVLEVSQLLAVSQSVRMRLA